MKKQSVKILLIVILWFITMFFIAQKATSQVIGKTTTEDYKASFEKKSNIDSLLEYNGPKIPIQILSLGISEEVYAMYPELKDKRVGLGVTNIVVEFLEETNHFTFTEDKTEIISLKDGEVFSVNPRQDNIQHAGIRTFKYHVPQHRYLPKAIVRLGGKTYIYPEQIECHPDTTLDDIIVDIEETVTVEETTTLQTPHLCVP